MIAALDANGTVREWAAVNLLDANGTVREVETILMLDANGTVREAYSSAGAPSSASTFITPEFTSTSSSVSGSFSRAFTVSHVEGAATYVWGTDGGTVVNGGTTATATCRVSTPQGETGFASFWCDVTVGGVASRAYCSMEHSYNSRSGSNEPLTVPQ